MNSRKFWSALFLMVFAWAICASASDTSSTLNKVQNLMKEKNFSAAKSILNNEIKQNQKSYKLWLALGYVYEAEENFDLALKAFLFASGLKANIPGLVDRIMKLQKILKMKESSPQENLSPSRSKILLKKARYQITFGQELDGFKTFYEAVKLDRSILSNDYGLIKQGLNFFKENVEKTPDAIFYLGAYFFYSGQYQDAATILTNYLKNKESTTRHEDAEQLLNESHEIIKQAKTRNAEKPKSLEPQTKSPPTKIRTSKILQKPAKIVEYESSSPNSNQISQTVPGELFSITQAKQKTEILLKEYESENDPRKKLQIIWRLGLIRIPTPEVMAKFCEFLNSDNIETIFATLEATVKIGLPGAQVCAPYMVALLDNADYRIKYKAVFTFAQLPLASSKTVPKLVKMYHDERLSARQGLIINTIFAYGSEGISILKRILSDASGPNKRPIAEILSIITGEDVEALIRDS